MNSYLPGAALGIALTAAAFGFGAASVHAADYTDDGARTVATSLSPAHARENAPAHVDTSPAGSINRSPRGTIIW